ncbi:MAG: hypothetical protein AAGG01_20915, partial [Planctomycetota bacterium]
MRFGFSTGALAKADFRAALRMLEPHGVDGVEISALRMSELDDVLESVPTLDLKAFEGGVSVHAPSKFTADEEGPLVERLQALLPYVEGV